MDIFTFRKGLTSPTSRFAIFCATISFTTSLFATPEITSTDFDQTQNVLTISGSGFGNPGLKFAFLDNINRRTLANNGSLSSFVYEELWEQYGTDWAVPLIPRQMDGPFPEAKDLLYYGGPGRSNNSYLKPVEAQKSRNLYVSWNYRPSLDPNEFGGSNKFIRIWDDHSGTHTRISWTQMHLTYGAKDIAGSDSVSWGGWSGKVNEWNLLELYVNSDNNIIKSWTNGKLVHNVSDFIKSTTDAGLGIRLLGFDPSVGDPYSKMEIYIDNLYVSNTPARIVFSTESTWNDSLLGKSATQLPLSWNDNSIQVMANLNELEQESFIYIIDENRLVNQNGYPVSGCTQCPAAPKLTIE